MSEHVHEPEAEALRDGAEVELAADDPETQAAAHTTRTINDLADSRNRSPLTTDAEVQETDSVIDPTAS